MPTAIYKDANGKRVPSVTTILAQMGSAEGIMRWANTLALSGVDAVRERTRLARIGTAVHDVCVQCLFGIDLDEAIEIATGDSPDVVCDELYSCLDAWRGVLETMEIGDPVLTEGHMTHTVLGYGGTPDAITEVVCGYRVVDFKTGSLKARDVAQLAAYRELYCATAAGDVALDRVGGMLISLPRDWSGGRIVHLSPDDLDVGFESFISCLRTHRFESQLRKMVK